ncbi:MAG: nucleotidyl transferase AbiEii/AbiGii toxin family protein [bacterium]|nr:nucleotidyl transferase AbiEii/AbiGii toxin family protein [bacterium]
MILNYSKEIVNKERKKSSNLLYIRSAIKEYLQILVLQYIYTTNDFKTNFIFTGGTCLRHFYGIDRLSEDLDFDYLEFINSEEIANRIEQYFISSLKYPSLKISIKQQGKQILLKFPLLRELRIAGKSESELLYIKIDLTPLIGSSYRTEKTSKSAFGYNFVTLHYDLPSLFAGKVSAILTRNLLTGRENKQTIKGRDFYDLLWYLKNDVRINIPFLREKMSDSTLNIKELIKLIDDKVNETCTKYKNNFKNDLIPFISNTSFITDYVDNYLEEYKRYSFK